MKMLVMIVNWMKMARNTNYLMYKVDKIFQSYPLYTLNNWYF